MKNLLPLLLMVSLLNACEEKEKKSAENANEEMEVSTISRNSPAFNNSFQKLLTSYYELKDALVNADTAKANTVSRQLAGYANDLKLGEMTSDSTGDVMKTAMNYSGTIHGSALGLAGETAYDKKKKEFQMISDAMYDLVRTVKYDRQKIYHQHCPMAINDTVAAYWLSNNVTIINPYLGRKHPKYKDAMLSCGEVTDSLDFRSK